MYAFFISVVPLPDPGFPGVVAAVYGAVCSLTRDLHQNSRVVCDPQSLEAADMLIGRGIGPCVQPYLSCEVLNRC